VATILHVSTLKEPHRKQSRVTSWRCTMCTMGADENSFVDEQSPSLRQIIDSAPALIHTSRADGYLDFFNQGWLNFVGQPLEKLLGWKWTSWIHPEDVESFVQKWRESIATGEGFEGTARVRRADGVYRWMLHHKLALRARDGGILKWQAPTDWSSGVKNYARVSDSAWEEKTSDMTAAWTGCFAGVIAWV
jgi:PAS domain S-box-containing protein